MAKIKIKGLDEAQRKLEQTQKGLKELDGKHSVSFAELFPSDFMCKYTKFSSMSELLDNGGFHVGSQEDFRNIPNEPFDRHIAAIQNMGRNVAYRRKRTCRPEIRALIFYSLRK